VQEVHISEAPAASSGAPNSRSVTASRPEIELQLPGCNHCLQRFRLGVVMRGADVLNARDPRREE
jgi:hypothetical protein